MTMDDNLGEIRESNFICTICNYNTQCKYRFERHNTTAKHIKMTDGLQNRGKIEKNFQCHCGKVYKHRQGLHKHRQLCCQNSTENNINIVESTVLVELFKEFLNQQNKNHNELINKLIEREPATSTVNNTTNNNQKFNLNFFLNETCKDAMNIQEFIENIKISFEDLLTIGNSGFVNGLSDIFIKQLRDLEVEKRPIHCTDSKRDTIYLKENNSWEKDDKENKKLKDVLEKIEYKNVAALHNWCGENPDSKVNNTPQNLLRDKIFMQTLQGDERTRDKIIKNILKEVIVIREP